MCLVLTTLERVWSGRGTPLHAGLWLEHTLPSGLLCSLAPELCSTISKRLLVRYCVLYFFVEFFHRFYLDKFEDYPKSRKAFIPFVL